MVGVIRNWDILTHPIITIRSFGWLIFFLAIFAGGHKSFLSLLQDSRFFGINPLKLPALVDRCIELELRTMKIYGAFAKTFAETGSAHLFFKILAQQEEEHANLLDICKMVTKRAGWNAGLFNPLQDLIPSLERQMNEAEAAVYAIGSLDEALRLVVQIESSEINPVFHTVLVASNSTFVKNLKPFQKAMERHMACIADWLPELAPHMRTVSRELRAKFFLQE